MNNVICGGGCGWWCMSTYIKRWVVVVVVNVKLRIQQQQQKHNNKKKKTTEDDKQWVCKNITLRHKTHNVTVVGNTVGGPVQCQTTRSGAISRTVTQDVHERSFTGTTWSHHRGHGRGWHRTTDMINHHFGFAGGIDRQG